MSKAQRISIENKNGDVLYGLCWHVENSVANVIIMEGMEEHSSRYDHFAQYLNKEGFNVYCIDAYGQGENVKQDLSNIGLVPSSSFRKMVQAVDALVVKLRISCRPTFIFSHSMGSFMCQDYIQRYTEHVSKVVLCGSGSKNPAVPLGFFLSKMIVKKSNRNKKAKLLNKLMFGNFNKKIEDKKTAFDWLSYNQENVDKYIADPLCGYGPTNGFCYEFLKGMNRLYKKRFLQKIRKDLDIFIISGSEDPVTNYGASVSKLEKMYKDLNVKNVQTKVYEHMRHEILNEDNREEVYRDVVNFFKQDLEKKNVI
ncbi:MAG: alpha/beta fold hydrolase [Bacilli bacterium]|nr:alpha/beta fold hydrolase [Bacilli bacterium]